MGWDFRKFFIYRLWGFTWRIDSIIASLSSSEKDSEYIIG